MTANAKMELMILSGRSGSGKTIALRILEDLGFYCVDNLPLELLPELTVTLRGSVERIAVSVDIRNLPKEKQRLEKLLETLKQSENLKVITIFLHTETSVLIQRFSETRRLHPLSSKKYSLEEAIEREAYYLMPLHDCADLSIDTSDLNIHQLSEILRQRILGQITHNLILVFESFGFKHGIPKDADFVFDARFLPNPHWVPELQGLTGLDDEVRDYLSSQPEVGRYQLQLKNLLFSWLPLIERTDRSYLTVCIGCTGGQHRSVYLADYLARAFKSTQKHIQIRHRAIKN